MSRQRMPRPKRVQRNREYYASAEWRAKRKAVFERDGYRCVETVYVSVDISGWDSLDEPPLYAPMPARCPNRGEIVNGKQTARGLVAEEKSYGHRGHPDAIDRIVTRCKDCDRRLTPFERINHANGFQRGQRP